MVHQVEEGFQVEIDHTAVAGGSVGLHGQDGLLSAAPGVVAITRLRERWIEDRHEHLRQRLLDQSVGDRGNA